MKLDSSAIVEWKLFHERIISGLVMGYGVQQTGDGGYIIAGTADYLRLRRSRSEIFLLRLDADGNVLWERSYGG